MPLLHLHIDEPSKVIELPHDLKAQSLILRQVMINKDIKAANDVTEDGVQIGLSNMFNGFEMLSNKGDDNKLFLPIYSRANSGTPAPLIYPLHIKLNSEDIKSRFTINVFKKDGITPVSFNTAVDGYYKSVDLYFEFQTAQHFTTIHNPGQQGFHNAV